MKYRGPHPIFYALVASLAMWAGIFWAANAALEKVMN